MQCGISQCFFDMLGEIFAGQRQPVDCAGQSLHRSELRLMQLIGEAPQLNVSELSERAGVTKSAVTQMSGKLCEKGLIDARKTPHNKKEKYFCLTKSGRSALDAYENANRRVSTGLLNDLILDAVRANEPASFNGRRLKIYYCSQPSVCPPTFVLFVNDEQLMHFSYKRYLENVLRRAFDFSGTPIRLVTRNRGENESGMMG